MELSIGEIAAACGGRLMLSPDAASDTRVSSVVIDSRQVTPQGVFLATVGERVDGHRFITAVFEQGAVLAITQKTPEQVAKETGTEQHWGSYVLVEDTLQSLKDLAEYYRSKLTIPIVGITGSVGKTSTKEAIAGVLSEKYQVLKTEGNYNNEIGVPLTLLKIRKEHTAAVVEMGISDFGEMHRLSKMVRPNICVLTNIGQCHLENLKTRDGILKAKSEIFDFMAEDGEICLYGGDDKLSTLTEVKGHKPHFFGWGENPLEEVVVSDAVSHGLLGSDAELECKPVTAKGMIEKGTVEKGTMEKGKEPACGKISIHVPLPGSVMVLNSAAAACVGRLLGLTLEQIAQGIAKVQPVNGRSHLIALPHYTLIDDCYNANPVSMKAAVDLLSKADTEKTAILGDMFELGENSQKLHREVGVYAASAGIQRILCVGEASLAMYQGAVEQLAAEPKENCKAEYFETRDALLQALRTEFQSYIPEGSTVLVKASHGMEFTEVIKYLEQRS